MFSVSGAEQLPSCQFRELNTSHHLSFASRIPPILSVSGAENLPSSQPRELKTSHHLSFGSRLSRSILTACRCLCLLTGTVHSCRPFSPTVTAQSHILARSKASGQLTTVVISCVAGASSRTSRQHNLTTSQHYSWHSLKSTRCTDMKASPTGTH